MSSEQEIKATVTIEGEVSMGRYYVPNADMDETRKRLREAGFLLTGREGMSSSGHWFNKEIKATVTIVKEVSMGIEGENIPMVEVDPMLYPVFPILGVFRLNGQPKRDGSTIVRFCKASQSPVYPIRDTILAANHGSCPSLSSSGPRQWGESALKTSRLPGALSLLARSWLYPPSAWRRR